MHIRDIIGFKDRDVATIRPDALVVEAADIMDERKIGVVVVCSEEGRVMGMISERDIVRAVADGTEDISTLQVNQLYSEDPAICTPDDPVGNVWETMRERRFRHMPVVEFGKLVGIVSLGDLLARMLEEAGLDSKAEVWSYLEFL